MRKQYKKVVIPAKAGIQTSSRRSSGTNLKNWIPASAGMTPKKISLILITTIAFLFATNGCTKKEEKTEELQEVQVVSVEKGDINRDILFTGNIVAEAAFDVYPRATGKVTKKVLKEGDPVRRNQPILMIERDEVGYSFRAMPVVSLVDGIVGTIMVDVGANVSPQSPVATVVHPGAMRIKLDVPERYLPVIEVGTLITVRVDTLGGEAFQGSIKTKSPIVSEKTRTANVEIELSNTDGKLKHGMFGRLLLTVETHNGVLLLPTDAISWEGANQFVYIIKEGRAARTEVKTGLRTETSVEILDGVKEGDQVAHGELLDIKDGEQVNSEQ